jgi:hypothetical protein
MTTAVFTETSEKTSIFYTLIPDIQFVSLSLRISFLQFICLKMLISGPVEWQLMSDGTFVTPPAEVSWRQGFSRPKPGT